jgi:hypothetical protein
MREPNFVRAAREQLRQRVRCVRPGDALYATPESVGDTIRGHVVEVDDLVIAVQTAESGIVWVHGSDCPDLMAALT